jgi:protein phosphatase PTC7
MAAVAYDHPQPQSRTLKPLDLMQAGYEMVTKNKDIQGGGSTACIAVASRHGILDVAK